MNFATTTHMTIMTCWPRSLPTATAVHVDEMDAMKKKLVELDKILGGGVKMNLFKVYVVDTKKLVVLMEAVVCGEDEGDAMADLALTDEIKVLKKRGRIAIMADMIGTFERFRTVAVEMEKDD